MKISRRTYSCRADVGAYSHDSSNHPDQVDKVFGGDTLVFDNDKVDLQNRPTLVISSILLGAQGVDNILETNIAPWSYG